MSHREFGAGSAHCCFAGAAAGARRILPVFDRCPRRFHPAIGSLGRSVFDASTSNGVESRRPSTGASGGPDCPVPTSLPRPVKLTRNRTHAVPPPAHVRVLGGQIEDDDREQISRKLGMKLGKFAASIERITVRLSDANGQKGVAIRSVRSKSSSAGFQASSWRTGRGIPAGARSPSVRRPSGVAAARDGLA